MKKFVNKDRIIEANINEPNQNSGENWDVSETRGWQLVLTIGYYDNAFPINIVIPKAREQECIDQAIELGLTCL